MNSAINRSATIDLYEDTAGGLYLARRGDEFAYQLDEVLGTFDEEVTAWLVGDWDPTHELPAVPVKHLEEQLRSRFDDVRHIATWDNGEITVHDPESCGGTGAAYLGLEVH